MRRSLVRPLLGVLLIVIAFAAWLGFRKVRLRPREDAKLVEAEISRLTRVRDSMRTEMTDVASRSDLFSRHPEGDVLIGVPTPFLRGLVRDVVKGWFYRVDLHLKNIDAHTAGSVEAKLPILGTKRVGDYELTVHIDDIRGRLEPGTPTLNFGGDMIRLALPVSITGGSGSAHITLDWKSKGAASVVCGNLSTTKVVTGTIRPETYTVNGRVKLGVVNGVVVADPSFPDLAVRLFIVPSQESLATLDSVLSQKGGLCGVAVRKAKVAEKIRSIVEMGINVKLPQKFFRPIRLPIAVRTVVPVEQGRLSLTVQPSGLIVWREMVWLGAQVGISAKDSAQVKHVPVMLEQSKPSKPK